MTNTIDEKIFLKGVLCEDFVNYRKASMFLAFPHCTMKCEHESGCRCCQNDDLVKEADHEFSISGLVDQYITDPITHAIVFGGLEPFDDYMTLIRLVTAFRKYTLDDIVVYTGYTKEECEKNGWLDLLRKFDNIIVKYGRYLPGKAPRHDKILGVELASENQYAEVLS